MSQILPKFKVDGMHKICEACQFGKQTKNVFPHDKNVSKRALDVGNRMTRM